MRAEPPPKITKKELDIYINKKVDWFIFARRKIEDFPPIILGYFFIGNWRVLGLKNLLYINERSNLFAFRDREEIEKFYLKIKRFKKNNFLKVARDTKEITQKTILLLKRITPKNLADLNDDELRIKFNAVSAILYKFAAYFVYVQYIGHAFGNKPEILKYFDRHTIFIIRVRPIIREIQKKLKIFFREISKRKVIKSKLLMLAFPREIENILKINHYKYFIKLRRELKLRKGILFWVCSGGNSFFTLIKKEELF